MNLYRDDNQYYSQIVNEGTARYFRNGQSSTSSNRLHVNNQNTAKPDYIINQMSVDGRRMIEWGFPNYPGNNGKYDASHCLPKSSGGSNSNKNMLPVNPDINRGSKNYEFHRGNEEKTKDLINKCKDDQKVQYVTTGWYGEEWKNKQDRYGEFPYKLSK